MGKNVRTPVNQTTTTKKPVAYWYSNILVRNFLKIFLEEKIKINKVTLLGENNCRKMMRKTQGVDLPLSSSPLVSCLTSVLKTHL